MPISLKPSESSVGGGLWSDIDATISKVAFETNTFQGKVPEGVTVLELTVTDDSGEVHEQLLSCGKGVSPTKDGKGLEDGGKFNSNSNAMLLLTSLVNAGFPESRLEDDITVLVGGKFHFERVAAPKRPGVQKGARADGKVYDDTILVVTAIKTLPWDAPKAGKGGSKAVGKSAPASTKGKSGGVDETREAALAAVAEVVVQNAEGVTKQQLAKEVFQLVKTRADKADIIKLVNSDAFLEEVPDTSYGDGVLSMA